MFTYEIDLVISDAMQKIKKTKNNSQMKNKSTDKIYSQKTICQKYQSTACSVRMHLCSYVQTNTEKKEKKKLSKIIADICGDFKHCGFYQTINSS